MNQWYPDVNIAVDLSHCEANPGNIATDLLNNGERYDVLHVVTMLNSVLDNNFQYHGEPEFMEGQIKNLVQACSMFFDRVYLAIGGKAEFWGYAPEWDLWTQNT